MRALHLPYNVASQIQIQVRALRTAGVEARGLITSGATVQSAEGLELLGGAFTARRRFSPAWFRDRTRTHYSVLSAVRWSDVIHYHYGGEFALPGRRDARIASLLGKLRLVTFWGTDIRVPDIECEDNPYFAEVYPALQKWSGTSRERSYQTQEWYAQRGFHCVLGSESMLAHVDRKLFPKVHLVRCAIDPEPLNALPSPPNRKTVVVVHAPSDPVVKGTPAVSIAVEALQRKGLDFEFILIHNTPRNEALRIMREADVFLDQFVLGAYGMASIEAMALGKPVICYIKPSLVKEYPADLPIVNARQHELGDALERLIHDDALRWSLGERGRAFVETYHSTQTVGKQLRNLYQNLLRPTWPSNGETSSARAAIG